MAPTLLRGRCDRHGHELAGESPATTLERRECVDKGKGARRNSLDLPEEGYIGEREPMRDLKEAGVKPATQARCEPPAGFAERARYLPLPKPDILSVFRRVEEVGGQGKCVILPGDGPSVPGRCNCDSEALSSTEM
jgi:hypothetical protein